MQIVVVGAGPAGTRSAQMLAKVGSVALIGAEASMPYNRVALSKFLAGDIEEGDLVTHEEQHLAALGVMYRPATRILSIDRAAQTVLTDAGDVVEYDTLVLALGAHAFRLPLPGADLPGVSMYRTLDEVRTMLVAAKRGGDAVVIGGGLLGLEAACGLALRGMKVTVVHAVDRLMERQLDPVAARLLAQRLAGQGILLMLSGTTASIEGTDHVTSVRLTDGAVIPADIVVMAVGIRPETKLARNAGLEVARGIVVDDGMRTSDPAIWAVGECAEYRGLCCGLVAPALAQAEIAARVIAGEDAVYVPEADATALKVAGAGVWSAGEIESADSEFIVYHDPDGGEYRKFVLRDDRLVGAMLYGETGDAAWYQSLIGQQRKLSSFRDALPFGPAYAPAAIMEAAE